MKANFAKSAFLSVATATAAVLCSCSSTDSAVNPELASAKMPAKPDKAQVKAYVDKVLASGKSSKVSPDDPRIKALTKVGDENADVLVDSIGVKQGDNACLAYALIDLAGADNKWMMISRLQQKPVLASVVFAKEWEQDAANQLLSGLRDSKTGLPYDWLRASLKVKSPAAKSLVKEHFIRHPYSAAFKALQDAKLELSPEELDKAFVNLKPNDHVVDPKFAKAGSKLALAHIAAYYKSVGKDCPAVWLELAGYSGPAAGFSAWMDANKDALVFSKEQGKFVLTKGAAPAAQAKK